MIKMTNSNPNRKKFFFEIKRRALKENKKRAKKNLKDANEYLLKQIIKASSNSTSYSQLKALGHPYRKGGPGVRGLKRYELNRHTRQLLSGFFITKTKEKTTAKTITFSSTVTHSMIPFYVKYVFQGTKKMYARDVISGVANDPQVKAQIAKILRRR